MDILVFFLVLGGKLLSFIRNYVSMLAVSFFIDDLDQVEKVPIY